MSWVESINSFVGARLPPGTVQPMYGVPIVKYGPPPSPVPYDPGYTGRPISGIPNFDLGELWQMPSFTMPDFGHMGLTFPKLMAGIALIALMAITILGLALRGSAWYLKKRN